MKCKWMPTAILKSVNYKNKFYKSMELNKDNPTLYANLKTNFNTYLKTFNKFKNNISKTYNVIN